MLAIVIAAMALMVPGAAYAACGTFNVPDSHTTPSTSPMASSGSIDIAIGTLCDPFALNIYPSTHTTYPSHGTVSVAADSGVITYTNNGDGATSDSFVVEDASGNPFTVNVAIAPATSPITVSPASLPAPQVGTPYSQTLSAAGGTAPYSYVLASGALPPGLSLSGSTISGTPDQAGSYTATLTVTDSASVTGTKSYTVTVPNPSNGIAVAAPPAATLNAPYNHALSASGALAPYTFSLYTGSTLPPGLSLAGDGTLSGTPTSTGSFSFQVVVTDSSPNLLGTSPGPYFKVVAVSLQVLNTPPTTGSASATVAYDSTNNPITLNISGAAATSVAVGTQAAHGTATASGTSITYTPTSGYAGPDSFTYTASNGAGTSSPATVTITVSAPSLSYAPGAPPNATAGASYSQSIAVASGGAAPYSYAVTSGTLPLGISLSPSGTLSGTATAQGTFVFGATATDSSTGLGPFSKSAIGITLVVNPPVIGVAPTTLPSGAVGAAYSQTVTASGGIAPYSFSTASTLPTGMSLSNAGVLSGTPTQAGSFNIVIRADDSTTGPSAPYGGSRSYTLTIAGPTIAVSPGTLPNATVGTAYSQTITASGGTTPYSFSAIGALPAGMSLSNAGVLSGTPTQAGSFPITIQANDSTTGPGAPYGGSQNYTLQVAAVAPDAPVIGTATAGDAQASINFTGPTNTGGTTITGYTATSNPGGITGTGASSPLTVTGLTNGIAYTFTVTATNGAGTGLASAASNSVTPTGTQSITFANPGSQNFGTTPNLSATSTSHLTVTFTSATPAVCTVSGDTLTPVSAGTCTINADQAGNSAYQAAPQVQQSFSIVIPGGPVALSTPSPLPAATGGMAYSQTIAATGGAAPYSFQIVSGAVPPGMTFTNGGALNGTPQAGGTFSFAVRVTDAAAQTATQNYDLTVNSPPIALSPAAGTLPSGQVGAAYAGVTLSASGGTAPYSYAISAGSLPAGLSLSSSGMLSGTPTAAGTANFTVTASDHLGFFGTAAYSLDVSIAAPVVAAKSATTPYDTAAAIDLSGSITGSGITAVTIATAPAHGTVSVAGTTVTYTPAPTFFGGTDSFTYTATNSGGTSSPATVTITVAAPPAPTVAAKTVTTPYNTAAAIDLSGSVTGAGVTSVAIATAPAHGTVAVSGETVTYTPSSTFYGGADSFTYTAANAGGTSAPATVTVTVAAPAAPTVAAKTVTTPYNTAATIDLSGSISGAGVTSVAIASGPSHGSVSVTAESVVYTPAATYFGGTDSFSYTATNAGGTSTPALVTVTVQARPPLAFTPAAGSLPAATEGASYMATITAANGTAPYAYTVTGGVLPSGLSLNTATGSISGTPSATGNANFTVTATDSLGFAGTAAYTLAVSAPAITAPSLSATVAAGTTTTVDLTSGATGGPFTGAHLISLSPPSAGTATITLGDTADAGGAVMASLMASGHYKLRFTPSPTFSGTAVATYTLSNAFATSAPATVSFSVTALADPTKDADIAGIANAETEATKRFAQMEIDNFNSHLEQLHHGGCLTNSWGITLNDNRQSAEEQRSADEQDAGVSPTTGTKDANAGTAFGDKEHGSRKPPNDPSCSPFSDGSLAFWTAGSISFGSTDFTGASKNFDFTTLGISAGIDYKLNDTFVAGVGLGFGSDQSFISDDGTRTNGLAYSTAIYGSYHPATGVFLDGVAGYGWLRFKSKRFDSASGDILDGSRDGQQVFGSVTAGYETKVKDLFVSPYLRMSASRSNLDAFSEDSAALSAIRYGNQTVDTLTGIVGLRLGYEIPTDWGAVLPKLRLEYGHDFASGSSVALSYANVTGSPSYPLTAAETGRDYATITLGADVNVGAGWTFGADYGFTVDGQQGVGPQQVQLQMTGKF